MEGPKLESEVRVDDVDNFKHVRIPINRLRSRRLYLALRVKPKKTSSTSTSSTKKYQLLGFSLFPCHEIFMFLNQQFLGALQVEYQNKSKSPFETHPIHMWTFLTSICLYSDSCFQNQPKPKSSQWLLRFDPQTGSNYLGVTFLNLLIVHLPTRPQFLVSLCLRDIYTTNAGSSLPQKSSVKSFRNYNDFCFSTSRQSQFLMWTHKAVTNSY
ncbi:hypothetical protein VNO78_25490 [Psophocarpus tetragonolobus]|uniref:Uncharacterized protein n=1 Tax=Psophocarpus tetragonolobus TaxID=3891 RepID=A0AAN9S7W3_PSOTE